jgi:5'-nucleotidase
MEWVENDMRMAPRNRYLSAGLAVVALGAAFAAPLATSGAQPAQAVTIAGARSLSDQVSVQFQTARANPTIAAHVLAYNDFHGNLEPASLNIYGQFAGGAAYLAKAIEDRQAAYGRNHEATVFAGDNIGASPLANALFHEEPATIVANLMHVDFASVGNHEFDKGWQELKRIQNGGCPAGGCNGAPYLQPDGTTTNRYPGARFQYLSANVIKDSTGQPLFPAYGIKKFSGGGASVKVGFIGEVLKDTPTIVTPTGVAGLTFQDEATAANQAVAALKAKGVNPPILVVHQGGFQSGTAALNGCAGNLAGSPIAAIAQQLDPSVKIIISAHTHAEYRCTITTPDGVTRLVTSASSFGRVLSDITLSLDAKTGELLSASAENVVVKNALNSPGPGVVRQDDPSLADPQVASVVSQYVTASAPLANAVIGKIQGDLTRTGSAQGESTLGDVIADAQLAATSGATVGGAQVAFMNPGGIRGDLLVNAISSGGEAPGEVTYGEAFTVQPFGNSLVTKTMTGDQIRRMLQQQFLGCGGQIAAKTIQVSSTFKFESNAAAADCASKIGQIWVNGVLVGPTDTFRVTMNNFLATGGDGFTVFNEGTNSLGGAQDIDALVAYFQAAGAAGIPVPTLNRIVPPAP